MNYLQPKQMERCVNILRFHQTPRVFVRRTFQQFAKFRPVSLFALLQAINESYSIFSYTMRKYI